MYQVCTPRCIYLHVFVFVLFQIHENEEPGDVLVFLPGQNEIENLENLLQQNIPKIMSSIVKDVNNLSKFEGIEDDFLILPLYASLSADEQKRAFDPCPKHIRKFILATNIAETSVTISGIKYGQIVFFIIIIKKSL